MRRTPRQQQLRPRLHQRPRIRWPHRRKPHLLPVLISHDPRGPPRRVKQPPRDNRVRIRVREPTRRPLDAAVHRHNRPAHLPRCRQYLQSPPTPATTHSAPRSPRGIDAHRVPDQQVRRIDLRQRNLRPHRRRNERRPHGPIGAPRMPPGSSRTPPRPCWCCRPSTQPLTTPRTTPASPLPRLSSVAAKVCSRPTWGSDSEIERPHDDIRPGRRVRGRVRPRHHHLRPGPQHVRRVLVERGGRVGEARRPARSGGRAEKAHRHAKGRPRPRSRSFPRDHVLVAPASRRRRGLPDRSRMRRSRRIAAIPSVARIQSVRIGSPGVLHRLLRRGRDRDRAHAGHHIARGARRHRVPPACGQPSARGHSSAQHRPKQHSPLCPQRPAPRTQGTPHRRGPTISSSPNRHSSSRAHPEVGPYAIPLLLKVQRAASHHVRIRPRRQRTPRGLPQLWQRSFAETSLRLPLAIRVPPQRCEIELSPRELFVELAPQRARPARDLEQDDLFEISRPHRSFHPQHLGDPLGIPARGEGHEVLQRLPASRRSPWRRRRSWRPRGRPLPTALREEGEVVDVLRLRRRHVLPRGDRLRDERRDLLRKRHAYEPRLLLLLGQAGEVGKGRPGRLRQASAWPPREEHPSEEAQDVARAERLGEGRSRPSRGPRPDVLVPVVPGE